VGNVLPLDSISPISTQTFERENASALFSLLFNNDFTFHSPFTRVLPNFRSSIYEIPEISFQVWIFTLTIGNIEGWNFLKTTEMGWGEYPSTPEFRNDFVAFHPSLPLLANLLPLW
jgi:hypothetical protein